MRRFAIILIVFLLGATQRFPQKSDSDVLRKPFNRKISLVKLLLTHDMLIYEVNLNLINLQHYQTVGYRKKRFLHRTNTDNQEQASLHGSGRSLFQKRTCIYFTTGTLHPAWICNLWDCWRKPGRIKAGFLEMSNVNLVTEEIDLISAKRLFETVKRIVKKLDPAFVISARSSW